MSGIVFPFLQIPFHKDCGEDGVCISDLVLDVQQLPAAQ